MSERWYDIISEAPVCTLREFTEKHRLRLIVQERALDSWMRSNDRKRYYARFDRAEVKEGCMLRGCCGEGKTVEDAIEALENDIRGELLVINAYGESRREIRCPNYFEKEPQA